VQLLVQARDGLIPIEAIAVAKAEDLGWSITSLLWDYRMYRWLRGIRSPKGILFSGRS
jgi:hypothetical protein